MNGAIIVYSELGKGSAFHIYLPLVEGEVLPTSAAAPGRDTLRGTEHILIVDDETSLTQLAERSLTRLGYIVTVFNAGTAALAAFRADPEQYAILITDQTMPGLTGMDLARGVLALRPEFPVVLTSGFAHGALEAEALLAGIREVIAKPIVPTKLAEVIRHCLDQ